MKLRWWLICSVVAMPLCFYMSRSDWPLLPFLIGGVLLWPRAKYQILLSTGLVSFFMRLSLPIAVPDILLTGELPGLSLLSAAIMSAFVFAEAVLLTAGVLFVARSIRESRYVYVVGVSIGAICVLILGVSAFEDGTHVTRVSASLLRILVWLSPCALLTLLTLPSSKRSFWSVMASVCQGWTMGTKHPFGALARWESREAQTFDDVIAVQSKGLKLLLTASVLVLIKRTVFAFLLKTEVPRVEPPIVELLQSLQGGELPALPVVWGYVLWDWFDFFFRAWAWGATAIGIMRLSGFDLFRHTWRPFEGTTIFDFFQRSLFYFNDVIFSVVFWPVFTSLRFKNQKFRIFLSLFLSVGVFNTLLTTGYDWFRGGWSQPAELILKNGTAFICYLTYAGLLTLMLYPSILERLAGREKPRLARGGMQFVRIGMFIFVWSAVRVFERSLPGEYFLNWRLFAALFGLSV